MAEQLNERLALVEQIVSCSSCELHARCSAPVPFSGPVPTRNFIAIVGEAPGSMEDQQGVPFIGPAGQLLRAYLKENGIDPDESTILNTVSCFPHGTPSKAQVEACAKNRRDQLRLSDPGWVLLLGSVAAGVYSPIRISLLRGRPFVRPGFALPVFFATFHPAAALRQREWEKAMCFDIKRFAEMVKADRPGKDFKHWTTFIPDDCVVCDGDAWWLDDSGLGWCPDHMPDEGERRRRLLEAELVEAMKRRRRRTLVESPPPTYEQGVL